MLRENLEELGLDSDAIELLADSLFPNEAGGSAAAASAAAEPEEEEELQMEENVEGPMPDQTGAPANGVLEDVTTEEIEAAEAEAQWLLNPLSLLDLSYTKTMLMKKMKEGCAFQRSGQHANARAVYTKALSYEAPNKRMTAALYYNRSACQRQLGQLSLSLRDAQLAAENEPTNLRAWWRAADVAIVLGDLESANEAIAAGLKLNPRCQPLLQLKLRAARND